MLKERLIAVKEKAKTFCSRMSYTYLLVWETDWKMTLILLAITMLKGINPVISAFIGKSILDILVNSSRGGDYQIQYRMLLILSITQIGLIFIMRFSNSIELVVNKLIAERVTNNIKNKIMNKARNIDLASYDMPEFYSKCENANREATNRPVDLIFATFYLFSNIISISGFIMVVSRLNSIAALIIFVTALPNAFLNIRFRQKVFALMFRSSKSRRQMGYFSGLFTHKDLAKEVKLFGLADFIISGYTDVFNKYFSECKKLFSSEGITKFSGSMLSAAATGAIYIWIATLTLKGELSIGDFTLFTGAVMAIENILSGIVDMTSRLYEGSLFIDNLITFLQAEIKIKPISLPAVLPDKEGRHTIEFIDVGFKYPGTEKYILKNINLKILAGETIALIGLNGAGKTTLLKLMMRLYDPTEGTILLDGKDLRVFSLKELYAIFGVVFQDFGKYSFTVGQNIGFGNVEKILNAEQIEASAKKSEAAEFIQKLPLKYDTPLTRQFEEDGTELSIGQWQKIAIARAFFRDAGIFVLDEPTASLDPIAEHEIFSQFDRLRGDRTTIFISHRLSSATVASKIVLLENGTIKEVGSHKELMELNGTYARLFELQAERYRDKQTA